MATAFNAVIPQTSTPWEFASSSSHRKISQTSFSCTFSRPRKQIIHGNFHSFAAKIDSAVSDVELDIDNGHSPASTSFNSAWSEFARNVSGEWDGFGADFTKEGTPIELPEYVVPGAFREWEVKVFDWQTQCPSLADEKDPIFVYKNIKLLPTVGCEADAATRHSIDERNIGGAKNRASAFAYHSSGSYVSVVSQASDKGDQELLELEQCLVSPQDRESRVRVVQAVRVGDGKFSLEGVTVFVEQWYGPFRNGDQLGGCSIRDSAFASTAALKASEVVGVWQGLSAVATFDGSLADTFHQLKDDSVRKSVRDNSDNIILLPKQLWCSLKESRNGDICCEVGWLSSPGCAVTSKCTFSGNAVLKEISVASETLELAQFADET